MPAFPVVHTAVPARLRPSPNPPGSGGGSRQCAALYVGRGGALLRGVGVAEWCLRLVELQRAHCGRIVVGAEEAGGRGAAHVGAAAIAAALGQLVVVALYQMLGGRPLPVRGGGGGNAKCEGREQETNVRKPVLPSWA